MASQRPAKASDSQGRGGSTPPPSASVCISDGTFLATVKPTGLTVKVFGFRLIDRFEWFAEMPAARGVWGSGKTKEAALDDMCEAFVGWSMLHAEDGTDDLDRSQSLHVE